MVAAGAFLPLVSAPGILLAPLLVQMRTVLHPLQQASPPPGYARSLTDREEANEIKCQQFYSNS